MERKIFGLPACLALLLSLSACSTIETEKRDWSSYKGPGNVYFQLDEPHPVELLEP